MIVSKHRILQAYAVTYAAGKANDTRFEEVAKQFGIEPATVADAVAEAISTDKTQTA